MADKACLHENRQVRHAFHESKLQVSHSTCDQHLLHNITSEFW